MGVGPEGEVDGGVGGAVGCAVGDDVETHAPEDTFFGLFASSYTPSKNWPSRKFRVHAARPSEHSP
jgi:hypothetical protein